MSITIAALRSTENLWPNVIRRHISQTTPFATVISPDGTADTITFNDLENASNRAAWFLNSTCEKDTNFVYMGPNDIRYLVWVIAAMKTEKCVVFASPSNTVDANRKLFQSVGATKFLFAEEFLNTSQPLQAATRDVAEPQMTMGFAAMMSRNMLETTYPFNSTWDEIKFTNFMALHTSGTSGHPKPIYWNHQGASSIVAFLDNAFVGTNGTNLARDLFVDETLLLPFPFFHMVGISTLMACVFTGTRLVIPKSGTPLSQSNFTAMLESSGCTTTIAPPSVLESLLGYPPGLKALARLSHVGYTGGPLQPTRGAELARHLRHLFPVLGSTEGGAALLESTGDSSRWNAFKFVDVGQQMRETAPGIYELVYPQNDRVKECYGFFHVHPQLKTEHRTSDLFSPADDAEGWWIYRGRTDNWVVMTNGLKLDPTDIEIHVSSHHQVKGVLVAGSHRFRLCMLVEMHMDEDKENENEAVDKIWPLIAEANRKSPKFGRIPRELVLIAAPAKPFLRAAKGTIQRQLTISAYQYELDELYDRVENGLLTCSMTPIPSMNANDLVSFLTNLCQDTLDLEVDVLTPDDNLIALGLDSLSAFILLARLKTALRRHGVQDDKLQLVNPRLVYSTRTIRRMADALSSIVNGSSMDTFPDEVKAFEKLLVNYTSAVKQLANEAQLDSGRGAQFTGGKRDTIVLTGSTGSLGSHILARLIAQHPNDRIVCLNRDPAEKAQVKQVASFKAKNLLPLRRIENKQVSFVQAKFSETYLGLSRDDYANLSRRTACIIHNGFPVNWLLDIESFEPQIQALVNMLRLMKSTNGDADFLFVSSIAAGTPVHSASQKTAETVLDPETASRVLLRQGYARAKYICERLLEIYSTSAASNTSHVGVLRIGQICGSIGKASNGLWNSSEWFPSLIISSARFVGAIPESLGQTMHNRIDWIPVNDVASIVCELIPCATRHASATKAENKFIVYNIVNPQTTSWSSLLPALDHIIDRRIPPAEWIAMVEGVRGKDNQLNNLQKNPAFKLVDFYKQTLLSKDSPTEHEDEAEVDNRNLLKASATARSLKAITLDDMSLWMEAWGLQSRR